MKKKELVLAAAALMAGALAGGGTLAYFTYSATETNTFTVGALDIDEDEPDWDDDTDGKNLMPGVIRYKNTTVTNTTSARNGSMDGSPCCRNDGYAAEEGDACHNTGRNNSCNYNCENNDPNNHSYCNSGTHNHHPFIPM